MITGHLSLDLETKSPLDLVKVGVYRYAEEAEILMCSYSFDDGPVEIWDIYDGGPPEKLLSGLRDPKIQKHAFNSNFERTLIKACWGIDCPPEEWRCTAVLALTLGIPHHLADCAEFLNVAKKDPRGKKLIKLFTSPQRPTKKQPKVWLTKEDRPKEWEAFKAYCVQDTVVEKEIHKKLIRFDLPPEEWRLWALDQRMNDRGALIDTKLVTQAIAIDDRRTEALLAEAVAITGLQNPNSVAQLKQWLLEEHDQEIKSLNKKVVAELKNVLGGEAGRMLSIRSQLGKTSIDKYRAMARSVCADGRVRGLLQFAGAQRTGRWAGRIIQVQNLPHNKLDDIDLARQIVLTGDEELLEMLFGNVSGVLSELLRTAFIAPSGDLLVPCDESAIEARVLAWTAGEQWRLEVFRTHGKIYEASASKMFHIPFDDFKAHQKRTGKHHPARAKGKVAELALGYQGATGALITMGALDMGLVEDELRPIVDAWRAANPTIVKVWEDIEADAITCVRDKIPRGRAGKWEFSMEAGCLFMKLPSGRRLAYPKAKLGTNKWGWTSVIFWGMDQKTKQWGWVETYGGKLCENHTQAVARDVLREALFNCEAAGYERCVFTVHDEGVFEVPSDNDSAVQEIEALFAQPISWAPGLPLKAAGFTTSYYKKGD